VKQDQLLALTPLAFYSRKMKINALVAVLYPIVSAPGGTTFASNIFAGVEVNSTGEKKKSSNFQDSPGILDENDQIKSNALSSSSSPSVSPVPSVLPTISFSPSLSQFPSSSPSLPISHAIAVCGSKFMVGKKCAFHEEKINRSLLRAVRCCSNKDLSSRRTDSQWQKHDSRWCSVWATSTIDRKCSGMLDFFQAKEFCENGGGRLCTSAEMAMGCAQNTGCKYNRQMVWTSSTDFTTENIRNHLDEPIVGFPASYGIATCGSSEMVGKDKGCPIFEEKLDFTKSKITPKRVVRCCSDADIGWNWRKNDTCGVWGGSKFNNQCSGQKTFSEANAFCKSFGGRLCTSQEVAMDCTHNTGCYYNREMVWTSSIEFETSSSPSVTLHPSPQPSSSLAPSGSPSSIPSSAPSVSYAIATCGSNEFIGTDGCPTHEEKAERNSLKAVRCCSDTGMGGKQWTYSDAGDCDVWAASQGLSSSGGCIGDLSFFKAKLFCESATVGGRLCTSAEVGKNCTIDTGCKSNRKMVWTSSTVSFTTTSSTSATAPP